MLDHCNMTMKENQIGRIRLCKEAKCMWKANPKSENINCLECGKKKQELQKRIRVTPKIAIYRVSKCIHAEVVKHMDYAKTSHEVGLVGQNEWGSYWPLVQILMQFEQRILLELYACVGGDW